MSTAEITARILRGLSDDEKLQMKDTIEYLGSVGKRPPEGSLGRAVNSQSPAVRKAMRELSEAIGSSRDLPFERRQTEAERADAFGLDADTAVAVKAELDREEVEARLQERMGVDTPDKSEPSARDIISAAYDSHTQGVSNV